MRNRWLVIALALMVPALAGRARGQEMTERLKMTAEGRQALVEARGLAESVRGLEGEARQDALARAARAYEAVVAGHAADLAACAQAHFEAGELWRRHGSLGVAEQAYAQAAKLDPQRYAERALLEVAHMQRRLDRAEEAHETYVKVAALKPHSSRAHEARLWIARTLQSLGREQEAIAAYRTAVEGASTPRQTIDACNRLANALIASGDLTGAAAALEPADQAVEKAMATGGPESLQKALQEMSARRALQRARDRKSGAYGDARMLERSLGKRRGG